MHMLYSGTIKSDRILFDRKHERLYEMAWILAKELALDMFSPFIDKGIPGFIVTVISAVDDKRPLGAVSKLIKNSDDNPSWRSRHTLK